MEPLLERSSRQRLKGDAQLFLYMAGLLIQAAVRQRSGTSHSNKLLPKAGTYLVSQFFWKFPP